MRCPNLLQALQLSLHLPLQTGIEDRQSIPAQQRLAQAALRSVVRVPDVQLPGGCGRPAHRAIYASGHVLRHILRAVAVLLNGYPAWHLPI